MGAKSSGRPLFAQPRELVRLVAIGERLPVGDLPVADLDHPRGGYLEVDAAVAAARLPPAIHHKPIADLAELLRKRVELLPVGTDVVPVPVQDLGVTLVALALHRRAEGDHRGI